MVGWKLEMNETAEGGGDKSHSSRLKTQFALYDTLVHLQSTRRENNAPKPATKDANDAQKQRQTNLEIDLLKSAWIQKDRESPPVSGKK
ncbi:hypothetical protein GQ600_24778 [Phytophthora cactorum]|nr:hypothetical protein GQ600_24778 [Phytophthora cactorum]